MTKTTPLSTRVIAAILSIALALTQVFMPAAFATESTSEETAAILSESPASESADEIPVTFAQSIANVQFVKTDGSVIVPNENNELIINLLDAGYITATHTVNAHFSGAADLAPLDAFNMNSVLPTKAIEKASIKVEEIGRASCRERV